MTLYDFVFADESEARAKSLTLRRRPHTDPMLRAVVDLEVGAPVIGMATTHRCFLHLMRKKYAVLLENDKKK